MKTQKNKFIFAHFIIICLAFQNLSAEYFKFKDKAGNASSFISTVVEQVYYNGVLTNKSEIINRISSNVMEVENGEAKIFAAYMTTENSILAGFGNNLTWGEENISNFIRKENGELIISDETLFPTVRNVPVFPDKDVKIGEKWKAQGKEVHDLKVLTGTNEPTIIPFVADYKYVGNVEIDGKLFNQIEVFYRFDHKTDLEEILAGNKLMASSGYSQQTLFWDNERGVLDHYREEFSIKIQDIARNTYIFEGRAQAEVTEYKMINTQATADRLQESVNDLHLENVNILQGEKGITISLENIQFEPDSWVLLPSEKVKIEKIAALISDFSNDLLITGHCADRGGKEAQQTISENRAEAVANYLENIGVRDKYHIFTKGKGATEPIASNNTEEGRQKNRRVEIVILE